MQVLAHSGTATSYVLVPTVLAPGANSLLFLNFTKSRRLCIAGSWVLIREHGRWTWYSNAGGLTNEIDHFLVIGSFKTVQLSEVLSSLPRRC